MDKRTLVAVYGCSLNLAGIATSLKANPDLEVHCVNTQSLTSRLSLSQLDPAAIVFDLSNPEIALDVMLLRDRPGLLLVGIDPTSDKLLILSCQSAKARSISDLVSIIRHNAPATA